MTFRRALPLLILSATVSPAIAQTFYTSLPYQFITPASRPAYGNQGAGGNEYSRWDNFYSPYKAANQPNDFNYPDVGAPFGESTAVEDAAAAGTPVPSNYSGNPTAWFDTRNPNIAQTGAPAAFIASSGNIYSNSGPTSFTLSDTTAYTLGSIHLQWETDGTLMDTGTLKLQYTTSTGGQGILDPLALIQEYRPTNSVFGFSFGSRMSAQWDVSALNITSYKLVWDAAGSSASLTQVLLDTSSTFASVTPTTRTFAGAADAAFGTGSNWVSGVAPQTRGNIIIRQGSSIVMDSSREISQLTLGAAGAFEIKGGSSLQINTGITTDPTAAANYTITAPLNLGSFNIWDLNANTTLTLNTNITGAAAFLKAGEGTLYLKGTNTFAGQVAYDGGTTYISGSNSYTGTTNIFSGTVYLQTNAPSGAPGAFGSAATVVIIGNQADGSQANLIADGARTISRNISYNNGTDTKTLGGQNTGAGATYAGNIFIGATSTNAQVNAAAATDTVTFSGNFTGGATGQTLTKTGLGRVVLSGTTISYSNDTVVSQGTFQVAGTYAGGGKFTVSSGGTLDVSGTLNGANTLDLQGGRLGGIGTVNKAVTLDNGDTISPGASVGTLTTNSENWNVGGHYKFELQSALGTAGVGYDTLKINGTLTFALSSANKFTIEIASLTSGGASGAVSDFVSSQNYSWKIANATGGLSGFDASGFQFDTSAFSNSFGGTFNVSTTGSDVFLNYAAVPEPGSMSLLMLGSAALCLRRRRKR